MNEGFERAMDGLEFAVMRTQLARDAVDRRLEAIDDLGVASERLLEIRHRMDWQMDAVELRLEDTLGRMQRRLAEIGPVIEAEFDL